MQLSRRKFLRGSLIVLAAPAIVRASSLMPVKAIVEDYAFDWSPYYTLIPTNTISYAGRLWWHEGGTIIFSKPIGFPDMVWDLTAAHP